MFNNNKKSILKYKNILTPELEKKYVIEELEKNFNVFLSIVFVSILITTSLMCFGLFTTKIRDQYFLYAFLFRILHIFIGLFLIRFLKIHKNKIPMYAPLLVQFYVFFSYVISFTVMLILNNATYLQSVIFLLLLCNTLFLIPNNMLITISLSIVSFFVYLKFNKGLNLDVTLSAYVLSSAFVVSLFICLLIENLNNYKYSRTSFLYKQNIIDLSEIDSLTNIFNRQKGTSVLNEFLSDKKMFSVALFDIDNFKSVNDNFGHNIGDYVLKEIVSVVSKNIRQDNIFIRWGGEEFLLIFPNSDKLSFEFCERIRTSVENHEFLNLDRVTISIGICEYHVSDTIDTLVENADKAMYASKKFGKNKVTVFVR